MARLWSNRTPALIVSRSPMVMASLTNAAAVTNSRRWCDGSLEMRLKRLSVVVDEPRAGGNDVRRVVLAAFDLGADLPLMVGASSPGR